MKKLHDQASKFLICSLSGQQSWVEFGQMVYCGIFHGIDHEVEHCINSKMDILFSSARVRYLLKYNYTRAPSA